MPTPCPTLSELQHALRDGTTTVHRTLSQVIRAARDGAPEAWISRRPDADLLAEAAACDARLAIEGRALLDRQPLFGVPFAVKDNIDVAGLPTTAAFTGWQPAPATAHAAAVARLCAAGAIPMGETNLDQFAPGLVGTRSPFGAVPNAFDAAHVSGGSSSGSAAVVATGQVPFALGTDTAGSGRVPAGFQQVVGLKPTPGRVSTTGVLPACRSIDCVSVFTLTVDDAAQVLAVIEGPDPTDPYSRFSPGPSRLPSTLRVGVPAAPRFTDPERDGPVFAAAVARLAVLGHTVVPLDFDPLHRVGDQLYGGPWVAERHAVVQPHLAAWPEAFDPAVRAVVESATRFSATDLFRALYRLEADRRDTAATWRDVDVLMVPTAPGHPTRAAVAEDPLGANAALGTYTNFVNLLGWCALALPAGTAPDGLPIGVTFIAPGGADAALLGLGREWQRFVDLPMGATGRALPAPPNRMTLSPATGGLQLAVVGAHLRGLPLHPQLTDRGAVFIEVTTTAPAYRLHALAGTVPPKPGLVRVATGGVAIAVEVWELPLGEVGSFLAGVAAPLGLGTVALADGRAVHGFLCEAHAVTDAVDVSGFGGWRAYLAAR